MNIPLLTTLFRRVVAAVADRRGPRSPTSATILHPPSSILAATDSPAPGQQPPGIAVPAAPVRKERYYPSGINFVTPAAQSRWLTQALTWYTPQMVEYVMRQAYMGDLLSAWQLWDLMERTWPRLSKNLQQLKDAVLTMEWEVQPYADEGLEPTDSALEKANLVKRAIAGMRPQVTADENGWRDLLRDLLDARGKGLSVQEITWQIAGGEILPRCTRWVPPQFYTYDAASGLLQLRPTGLAGSPIQLFPDDQFIIGTLKAQTGHPCGGAQLFVLAWWWAASNFTAEWFLNYAQIFGSPIRWATYAPGLPPEDRTALENMLRQMGTSGWGAFPAGTTLDIKESGKGGGDNPQNLIIERADKICDLVILRQTLTSDVKQGAGSRALGEVHERVEDTVKHALAEWAAEILNEQFVRAIIRQNYGGEEELPRLVPGMEQEVDRNTMATGLVTSRQLGIPLPRAWVYEQLDIPMPAPGDDVIEPAAPVADVAAVGDRTPRPAASATEPRPPGAAGSMDDMDMDGMDGKNGSTEAKNRADPPARVTHPSDTIAAAKAEALGKAYKGALAPIRQIILDAASPEDAQRAMARYFADWKPERVIALTEEALQLCAAAGAAAAKTVPAKHAK